MSSNKTLGSFNYGGKKAQLEETTTGTYTVKHFGIDEPLTEEFFIPYVDFLRARRSFEQAMRRAIYAMALDVDYNFTNKEVK